MREEAHPTIHVAVPVHVFMPAPDASNSPSTAGAVLVKHNPEASASAKT